MAVSKLVLIGSGVGVSAATAGGVALYLTSGETIREHITKVSASNKKFIGLVPEAEVALKAKYSEDGKNKPKEGDKEVEDIVKWCKDSENIKFSSDKDADYLSMNAWCFVDTDTLLNKAKKNNKKDIVGTEASTEWQGAWDSYNTGKSKDNLQITTPETGEFADLNKSVKEAGGKALYKWCKAQENKKMYEVDAESNYSRYEKWCFQQPS